MAATLALGVGSVVGETDAARGAAPPHPGTQGTDLRSQVVGIVRAYKIPGAAALIQRNGRTLSSVAAGDCDVDFRIAVNDACVFHLASASKIFTSIAIMTLVQDSALDLDKTVVSILPTIPTAWSSVTVRQVMSHTSGLPDIFSSEKYQELSDEKRASLNAEQTIAYAAELPVRDPPGSRWAYNQTGYVLLGMVVERLSGKPFAQYVRDRILVPLGMTRTVYGDSTSIVPGRSAAAYAFINGALIHHFYPYPPVLYPAAGANSSLGDLAKFFTALDSGRLLKEAYRKEMWTPTRLTNGTTASYGLGWDLEHLKGHVVVEHSGAGSVWLGYIPDERLTVVFLTNLNGVEHSFEKSMPYADPILAIGERYLSALSKPAW